MKRRIKEEECKPQASSRFRVFVYYSCSTVCRLTFGLSMQNLLLCSSFRLLYDDARRR